MSLIQFRRRSILPPVVIQASDASSFEEHDKLFTEESCLLSLPPSEALKIVLPGLSSPLHSQSEEMMKKLNSDKNQNACTGPLGKEEAVKGSFLELETKLLHEDGSCIGSKKFLTNANKENININFSEQQNVNKGVNTNDKIEENYPLMEVSCEVKNDSENCIIEQNNDVSKENTDNILPLVNNSYFGNDSTHDEKDDIFESPTLDDDSNSLSKSEILHSASSNISSKNLCAINNNQKLKVLKFSGSNSSSYLQDYLQLLTSRSHFLNVGKIKKSTENIPETSMERRGSVPLISSKKSSTSKLRQRNSSGSSDKTNLRSLGSTYLDSYLGNLTDHSWIIYPTDETSSKSPEKTENSDPSKSTSSDFSPGSKNGEHMHRRLHFINPDKFFNVSQNKTDKLEDSSEQVKSLKCSNSIDNDQDLGLTDTSGIVVSPDVSMSSMDTDKFDTSQHLSSTSWTPQKEFLVDQPHEYTKETSISDSDLPQSSSETSSQICSITQTISTSGERSLKTTVTFSEIIQPEVISFPPKMELSSSNNITKLETQSEEELFMNSEESSITSTDDAEDEISTIVCSTQRSSDIDNNDNVKCLLSDAHKANNDNYMSVNKTYNNDKNTTGEIIQNCDNPDMLHNVSGTDGSISKLINMLKTKQQEELQELQERHKQEMNNFVHQILQLSSSQRLTLAESNSLNEVYSEANNISPNTLQSCHSSDMSASTNNDASEVSLSPYNHTNLVPSFFLHKDIPETNTDKHKDVRKISQIFSPARINPSNAPNNTTIDDVRNESEKSSVPKETTRNTEDKRKHNFCQLQYEAGLDLVPTRESDGVTTTHYKNESCKGKRGIAKLQAVIRGRRIRRLLKTSQIQQLLETLKEVAKLAHQFHHDILMDNIRKGDIDFHKALFTQERQAREKLLHTMVEMTPGEQIEVIRKDNVSQQRELQKCSVRSNYSTTLIPQSASNPLLSPRKGFSSTKPVAGGTKEVAKHTPKKTLSELPRPCKISQPPEPKPSKCLSASPRPKQPLGPVFKPVTASRSIPRRIFKKIEPNPQPHISHRRLNAPMCKSEASCLTLLGPKANKNDRNAYPIRGDVITARKPWR